MLDLGLRPSDPLPSSQHRGLLYRRSRVEMKSAEVEVFGNDRATGDDPRLALAHATEIVTNPEAEDKLIGIFGGVSSEESRAVQVLLLLPCRVTPAFLAPDWQIVVA